MGKRGNSSINNKNQEPGDEEDEDNQRGTWSNPAEFILCCLGYAVGLGNVWRFPYMLYENGGGAFLIPYAIMLTFVGIPAFFMELIMGQYSGKGPLHVWQAVPIFKGIGVGMLFSNSMFCVFYTMILAYALYYLVLSFYNPLPWDSCFHDFNTNDCYNRNEEEACEEVADSIWYNRTCLNATDFTGEDIQMYDELKTNFSISSTEQYFNLGILQMSDGIENTGGFVWQLAVALLGGWIVCFLCVIKGIRTTGKVVYFTALFPYVVLTILLIYACLLPGSLDGIIFYVKPDWQKLKTSKVWADAAGQIFFSLSVGGGGLMTFSSYNKFHNNVYRDALIVSIGNCLTSFYAGFAIFSVLGYMAHTLGKEVPDVVTDGSTLAFVAYPAVVARMPVSQLWAVLFFIMLVTLGLDSLFAGVETNITALVDSFPRLRRYKVWVTLVMCIIFFLLGLPMATKAGIYWLNVIAYYATGWSLIILGLSEVMVVCWIYGAKKLRSHVKEMCGFSIGLHWWIVWTFITPLFLIVILGFSASDFTPLAFGPYVFPDWAQTIGFLIALTPVAAILLFAVIASCRVCCCSAETKNMSTRRKFIKLFKPAPEWGPSYAGRVTPKHAPSGSADDNGALPDGRAVNYMPESTENLQMKENDSNAPPPYQDNMAYSERF